MSKEAANRGGVLTGGAVVAVATLIIGLSPVTIKAEIAADVGVPSSADTGDQLQEITVTAEKRSTSLQKTPAAVTALVPQTFIESGIGDLRAAAALIPDVRFQEEASSTEVYIRGVGQTLDYPQDDPPTSTNFNGVYIPREGTAASLYDLERIELLPGPQGTLYGRNTMGGAVNISFQSPTQTQQTDLMLEAGNFGLAHGTIVGNTPLSDALAIRFATDYQRRDGYQTSGADSKDEWAARLSALYSPSDDFTAYVWGSYDIRHGKTTNIETIGVNPVNGQYCYGCFLNSNPWNDTRSPAILALPANPALPPPQDPTALDMRFDSYIVGAQLDWKVANLTVSDLPSYLHVYSSPDYYYGAYFSNKTDHYTQYTNELRITGATGKWNWIGGLYLYRLETYGTFFSGVPISDLLGSYSEGAAPFGQATYSVTDPWRLTIGGRFSYDKRVGHGLAVGAVMTPWNYSATFDHFDWKLGTEYDITKTVMGYATVQTGYQPGTFNSYPNTPERSTAVGPAKLIAYTVGIKSREFNDRIQINNEIFDYEYTDLFASAYNVILATTQTFNAQKARIYGDQLDTIFALTASDRLNLSVGYLHARYVSFELPDGTANFDGNSLQYAPDWSITGGYYHDFRMSSGYIRAQANTHHESKFYGDYNNTPVAVQQAYFKTDASLTFYSNSNWSVGAWVKNISNVPVYSLSVAGSDQPFLANGGAAILQPPRTYGARFNISF
jgi:iron complex outermembrane recepter protein